MGEKLGFYDMESGKFYSISNISIENLEYLYNLLKNSRKAE